MLREDRPTSPERPFKLPVPGRPGTERPAPTTFAVRRCGVCKEIGGDHTGFSDYCLNGGRHEPEIREVELVGHVVGIGAIEERSTQS